MGAFRRGIAHDDAQLAILALTWPSLGTVPSVARLLFTAFFVALALWCAFTVLKPQSRFSGITRFRGHPIEHMRTRRVVAAVVGIGCLLAAAGAWANTT
jgi:hypothetical protein